MQENENKKIITAAAGKVLKELRGAKSNYLLGAEYEISTSLLNHIERGIKDPQFTTLFKLAETFEMKLSDFIKCIENIF